MHGVGWLNTFACGVMIGLVGKHWRAGSVSPARLFFALGLSAWISFTPPVLANAHLGIAESSHTDVCNGLHRIFEGEHFLWAFSPFPADIEESRPDQILDAHEAHTWLSGKVRFPRRGISVFGMLRVALGALQRFSLTLGFWAEHQAQFPPIWVQKICGFFDRNRLLPTYLWYGIPYPFDCRS
jgi:hypothetical protein